MSNGLISSGSVPSLTRNRRSIQSVRRFLLCVRFTLSEVTWSKLVKTQQRLKCRESTRSCVFPSAGRLPVGGTECRKETKTIPTSGRQPSSANAPLVGLPPKTLRRISGMFLKRAQSGDMWRAGGGRRSPRFNSVLLGEEVGGAEAGGSATESK